MCCFISSKKSSEKSSGKESDVAGRGANSVKGGSVVLSKNVLDDGKTCFFILFYPPMICFVLCYILLLLYFIRALLNTDVHIHEHAHAHTQTNTRSHVHVQTQH